MAAVLRIIDRFRLTGVGTVYMIKTDKENTFYIGDIYQDLRGNHFKIKGIKMIRRMTSDVNFDELPIGVLFELMDGVEACGTILASNANDVNFLFCNHPLYHRKVDEDYQEEYQTAGLNHACALFSYEDLQLGKLSLYGETISGLTIYRGWMVKPEVYRMLYKLLEKKGIILINSPEEYERYHTLPGWYKDFEKETAESYWEYEGKVENAVNITRKIDGSFIVKDFVKSRKHEWNDACFIQDVSDAENATKIITNFVNRQGSDLVGGIVLRRFEKLKQVGYHDKSGMPISEEYRVFIYAGRIHIIDDYWRANEKVKFSDEEYKWIESIAQSVRSNFVTVDLARKVNGELMIMEFGDGQVSGLQQIDSSDFYKAFEPVKKEILQCDESENVLILSGDPFPNKIVDEMKEELKNSTTTQELVDAYVNVHNKFWFIEDDLYDYDEGSEEYKRVYDSISQWYQLMKQLDQEILKKASEEGLLDEKDSNSGTTKRLKSFMSRYGYCDASGWWVRTGAESEKSKHCIFLPNNRTDR